MNTETLKHSELIAKFLSPACDDFNKIAFMSMPKQAIGSAAEIGSMSILSSGYFKDSVVLLYYILLIVLNCLNYKLKVSHKGATSNSWYFKGYFGP